MALPKEPRQKMINFMYLVLTAMLALNVSSEILNAFKVVDGSLIKSNVVVDNSTKSSIQSLEDAKKDPGMAAKAAKWKPIAEQANNLTQQLSFYIDGLKDSLRNMAGYDPAKPDAMRDDDLDAATRLMDTDGKGKELYSKLAAFQKEIVDVIPESDRKGLGKIAIDLAIPKTNNEASKNDWTTAYFHMTPTVAALTMLSKFQNDVKRSGNTVVDFCQQQLGKVVLVLDKFVPFTSQNSEYLLPGQPFQLQAGLGAFSSQVKPTVTINGATQQVNDDGYASFTETAGGAGAKTFKIDVTFKDPNTGEMKTTSKNVSYTVGQPSGASIFLTKMNVMYIGEENPITVSGGTGKAESLKVSFTAGSITGSGSSWVCVPTTPGNATVDVTVEGKTTPFPIRVKYLPDPVAMVGTAKHGPMQAAAFRAMGGVRCELENSDFQAPFTVTSYTVGGYINGQYQEIGVSGQQWGGNQIVAAAKPGSVVYLFKIHAKGKDGKDRTLNDLTFKLL